MLVESTRCRSKCPQIEDSKFICSRIVYIIQFFSDWCSPGLIHSTFKKTRWYLHYFLMSWVMWGPLWKWWKWHCLTLVGSPICTCSKWSFHYWWWIHWIVSEKTLFYLHGYIFFLLFRKRYQNLSYIRENGSHLLSINEGSAWSSLSCWTLSMPSESFDKKYVVALCYKFQIRYAPCQIFPTTLKG